MIKTKQLFLFVLLCIFAPDAWAEYKFPGSGTAEDPYVISYPWQWDNLAGNVEQGFTYNGKYFKLSDEWNNLDEPITTTVGTRFHYFEGIFDGNNKTLHVKIEDTNNEGTAPFRYILNVTIKNLEVKGSVKGANHTAGLVGFAMWRNDKWTNVIDNCVVRASVTGGEYNGGLVGHGKTCKLTIRNSAYNGDITLASKFTGGLQGWSDGDTLIIENSLFRSDMVTESGEGMFHPIAIQASGKTTNYTDAGAYYFYTSPATLTDKSYMVGVGTAVTPEIPENEVYGEIPVFGPDFHAICNISGIEDRYIYRGTAIEPEPAVMVGGKILTKGTDYTVTYSNSNAVGTATVTITGKGSYKGSKTIEYHLMEWFDLTEANTTLEDGIIYKVVQDMTIDSRIIIKGTVTLILGEGTTLTAKCGISVEEGNSLTIEGPGTLIATGNSYNAGIGGSSNSWDGSSKHGRITINGGNITAVGGTISAGIGGGCISQVDENSCITINGGIIKAFGKGWAAAIGGGRYNAFGAYGDCGLIVINGGQITAQSDAKDYGCGIGPGMGSGGRQRSSGRIVLGFTSEDDFIMATGPSEGFSNYLESISFTNGKNYYIEGVGLATPPNFYGLKNVTVKLLTKQTPYRLDCGTINDLQPVHTYSGLPVNLEYTVCDIFGTTLTKDTHYEETITNSDGKTVGTISAAGTYTLTVTGISPYTGTKSANFTVVEADLMINTTAEWDAFATSVSEGTESYSGKVVSLGSDITVTTMAGSNDNPFKGTFEGNGHTLTLNYTAEEAFSAPFRYVEEATIRNLKTDGNISSSSKQNAGLVGFSKGQTTIENCCSSVNISSSYEGDSSNGGFIAHVDNGLLTMNNCAFTGSLLGAGSTYNGGLVGWTESDNKAKSNLTHCLFAPTQVNMQGDKTIARSRRASSVNIKGCYYTQTFGAEQGLQVVVSEPDNELYRPLCFYGVSSFYYLPCTVSDVETDYLFRGGNIEVKPVVKSPEGEAMYFQSAFTATLNGTAVETYPIEIDAMGDHTLIITGMGIYSGSKTFNIHVTNELDLTPSTTMLEDGLVYIVRDNVTIDSRIQLEGTATLHLCDGKTLTAPKGIELEEGKTLTIEGETHNTGTLLINNCNTNKSGIGAYAAGTLIINGGTIQVTGGLGGAGIGGDRHDANGGSITINGGIVNATGGYHSAGIGGGFNDWAGSYGKCGKITILGGLVTARGGENAPAIGPGRPFNNNGNNVSGTVILGWTNATDFINVSGQKAFSDNLSSISFAPGKRFLIEGEGKATIDAIRSLQSLKLIPYDMPAITLLDNDSESDVKNADLISAHAGETTAVILSGRTLYMDGSWNTLCLPFNLYDADETDDLTFSGTPLEGATVKTLSTAMYADGTLTLDFTTDQTSIEAGKPYIVKWNDVGSAIESPVFEDVTIDDATADVTTANVEFVGSFSSVALDASDKSTLFLGADNKLYLPLTDMLVGACRAVFRLKGFNANSQVSRFVLNFGDSTTGIVSMEKEVEDDAWYTLDGRRLKGQPVQRGLYIHRGNKMAIK